MNPLNSKEPIVTAEKLLEHKRAYGHLGDFKAPETVLVCYQRSTMEYLLKQHPEFQPSHAVTHFYLFNEGQIGLLGDWGVGAPGLAIKIEELIALGAKRFIAVGTAGGLMDAHQIADFVLCHKALAEDGVAHLYLPKNQQVVEADSQMVLEWTRFAKERSLPTFHPAMAWSFSALFRETVADVHRVREHGCSAVEMEAATLYAIGQEKGVETLTLFVISDSITQEEWIPRIKEPAVRDNLHQLADWALEFCATDSSRTPLPKYVFKPYNSLFPVLFQKEKERITSLIKDSLLIEHVGSTSVPGLGGKGIIDIAIAVSPENIDSMSKQLQDAGYEFRVRGSVPNRLFFRIDLPDVEEGMRRYHVHLTSLNSDELKGLIGFRDYLRTHPEEVQQYAEVKKKAVDEANGDGEKYRKSKEHFFQLIP
ncbi:MAG: GrpB family protein [Verrucomicrobiota bacterium]|nr:GrpB family protein [Verrucomicrobiota bacterium]